MKKPVIFVVDDDQSLCRSLARLIKSAGFEVRTFTSAIDFLDQRCCNVTGCLVLDVRMPGMDGLELQEQMAAMGSTMPIILMSAHQNKHERQKGLKAGALTFLQKPFDDQLLIDAVRSAFSKNKIQIKEYDQKPLKYKTIMKKN